ncbi:MAG: diacylglycerol kinase family lipid kinase [Lachnospiraceae bacterium]|nr:diacylglycerol kinase family lipid kinase [Lachnospiraceae bacterium]
MNSLLIYNPIAGVDRNRNSQIGRTVRALAGNGGELTVYQTRYKGDAAEYICSKDMSRFDKIICCGGDGTLHEVVNALMRKDIKIPLGYIPQGTTNDYAKNLGISKKNAIECVKKGKTVSIDVGLFNDEYFNYVAAFGAFTAVSFATPQKFKNVLGYCAYLLEGIKSLGNIVPKHIRCQLEDSTIEDDVVIGMVTNALSVGGFSGLKQQATKLDDGMMEYLFIKMPQNVTDLQPIITLLTNGKVDDRYMYVGKTRKLCIQSKPMEWTLDGENGGSFERVEIEVLSKALNIIVGTE